MRFKTHTAGEGGWSFWVSPKLSTPYKMACCDCGLVHDLEFDAVEVESQTRNGWWKAKPLSVPFKVLFRARRNERQTARLRAVSESTDGPESPGLTQKDPQ